MSGYQPTFVPNQDDYGPTSPLATAANPVLANATKPTFKVNVHRNKTRRWVTARSYTYDGDDWGDSSDEHEDEDEEWEKEEQGRHLKNKGKDKAIEDIPPIPTLPPLKTSFDRPPLGAQQQHHQPPPPNALKPENRVPRPLQAEIQRQRHHQRLSLPPDVQPTTTATHISPPSAATATYAPNPGALRTRPQSFAPTSSNSLSPESANTTRPANRTDGQRRPHSSSASGGSASGGGGSTVSKLAGVWKRMKHDRWRSKSRDLDVDGNVCGKGDRDSAREALERPVSGRSEGFRVIGRDGGREKETLSPERTGALSRPTSSRSAIGLGLGLEPVYESKQPQHQHAVTQTQVHAPAPAAPPASSSSSASAQASASAQTSAHTSPPRPQRIIRVSPPTLDVPLPSGPVRTDAVQGAYTVTSTSPPPPTTAPPPPPALSSPYPYPSPFTSPTDADADPREPCPAPSTPDIIELMDDRAGGVDVHRHTYLNTYPNSSSAGLRSIVDQAFESDSPSTLTAEARTPVPLALAVRGGQRQRQGRGEWQEYGHRQGNAQFGAKRADSAKSIISPILPSGGFPPLNASLISGGMGHGNPGLPTGTTPTITEEPEMVDRECDGGGDGGGCDTDSAVITVTDTTAIGGAGAGDSVDKRKPQRISPVPSAASLRQPHNHRHHRHSHLTPENSVSGTVSVTKPGAEHRARITDGPVRMSSVPVEYGVATPDEEGEGEESKELGLGGFDDEDDDDGGDSDLCDGGMPSLMVAHPYSTVEYSRGSTTLARPGTSSTQDSREQPSASQSQPPPSLRITTDVGTVHQHDTQGSSAFYTAAEYEHESPYAAPPPDTVTDTDTDTRPYGYAAPNLSPTFDHEQLEEDIMRSLTPRAASPASASEVSDAGSWVVGDDEVLGGKVRGEESAQMQAQSRQDVHYANGDENDHGAVFGKTLDDILSPFDNLDLDLKLDLDFDPSFSPRITQSYPQSQPQPQSQSRSPPPPLPPRHQHQSPTTPTIKRSSPPVTRTRTRAHEIREGERGKRTSVVLTETPEGLGYKEAERPVATRKFSWEIDV